MFVQKICEVSDVAFESKVDVIEHLSTLALQEGKIANSKNYIEAVIAREKVVSTAIGYEVAIPHGVSEAVKEAFVGCLKLNTPVQWDEEKVSLVFMIGVPVQNREKEHIKILAMLSRSLMHEEFRNKLMNASDSEEFYQHIKQLETV